MFNRDFTKSNKDYFNKNKIWLISLVAFLVIGLVVSLVFGMNTNFELKGHYEFTVNVTESAKLSDCSKEIEKIVNSNGANFDSVSIMGEGDATEIVVRYMNALSEAEQTALNEKIKAELGENVITIENHTFVKSIVKDTDYIFTAGTILVMLALTSIFVYFRYNGASALTMLITSVVATLSFMSIGAIMRLSIGMSYFAMLVMLNMLLIYMEIDLFENMRNESWLGSKDYAQALKSAMKSAKFKQMFIGVALNLFGLLMVLFATSSIKYVSINVMFMAIVLLASLWYVVPFVWSVFITKSKIKTYKVKVENEKDIENQ